MEEYNMRGYKGDREKMILDLGEGISKNDFQNPKVEQIQKMIFEIQKRLYSITNKDERIDFSAAALSNMFGSIVLEWDLEEYDVNVMGEIFNTVCQANPFKTIVVLPKGIEDIAGNREYLEKVYAEIGRNLAISSKCDEDVVK